MTLGHNTDTPPTKGDETAHDAPSAHESPKGSMNTRTAACTALLALATLTAGCNSDSTSDDVKNTPSKSTSTPATAAAARHPVRLPGPSRSASATSGQTPTSTEAPSAAPPRSSTTPSPPRTSSSPRPPPTSPTPNGPSSRSRSAQTPPAAPSRHRRAHGSLGFPDDTRLDAPGISGGGVPKPEYPVDGARVKAGICLRGKTTFSVDKRTRPTLVIYAPEGRDPIERAVPTACTIHGRVRRATPAVTGLFAPHCEPPVTQPCSSHTSRTRMRRTPRRLRP